MKDHQDKPAGGERPPSRFRRLQFSVRRADGELDPQLGRAGSRTTIRSSGRGVPAYQDGVWIGFLSSAAPTHSRVVPGDVSGVGRSGGVSFQEAS